MRFFSPLLFAVLIAAPLPAAASIIGISIAPNSQANSAPAIANQYSEVAINGTLDVGSGVGICLKPSWVSADVESDFCLHQNTLRGSPAPYSSPYIPDPTDSTIDFTFDTPTIVRGVAIIEHINGVLGVSGASGDSLGQLQSVGVASSPLTSLYDGEVVFFDFGNMLVAGRDFALTITTSLNPSAFAVHRVFPLNVNGDVISVANEAIPEPGTGVLLIAGAALITYVGRPKQSWKSNCKET